MKRRFCAIGLALLSAGCARRHPVAEPATAVRLVDVARQAGIRFQHRHGGTGRKYFVETSGAGVACFDYDDDGRPDLYFVQSGELPTSPRFGRDGNRSALYHNDGNGHFTDVTSRAGVGNFRYGQGCCVGDFDRDGRLDLFVTNFGPNRLYQNRGDGTFRDVAPQAGVTCPDYNTGAAFADIDGDGHLDLYIARYARYRIGMDPPCSLGPGLHSYCPPSQFEGEPDVLLRNNGNGTFRDVSREAGIIDPHGKGLGVLFFDYNDDGRPDLYVANDGTLNRLYENLGNGRFRDVTDISGTGMGENAHLSAGMGVDAGDYDGDGRLDIVVVNFTAEPIDLYHNIGDSAFDLVGTASGLGAPSLPYTKFGTAFVDYDLDGWPDVIVANGHVADDIERATPGITYAEPFSLFRNLGTGHFGDVSRDVGPDLAQHRVGRGLAVGDLDGDGDPDVVVNVSNGAPVVFRNDGGNTHAWIQVRLRAEHGDPFALGARVTITAGALRQVREVRSGSSYLSQHDLTQTFGLGRLSRADRVQVRWPDGKSQEWTDLAVNHRYTLRQGVAAAKVE